MAPQPFFIFAGIWLGLLYASTVFSATVWSIQCTHTRGFRSGLVVSLALAVASGFWAAVTFTPLMSMGRWVNELDLPVRLTASAAYLWMGRQVWRSGQATTLELPLAPEDKSPLWPETLRRGLTMPWRLFAVGGMVISVSIHVRSPGPLNGLLLALGLALGVFGWLLHFVIIAKLFSRRVPVAISLRSLNKLRMLGAIVLFGLAVLCVAPLSLSL